MNMKKKLSGIAMGAAFLFLAACNSNIAKEEPRNSVSEVSDTIKSPSNRELEEILEKTIPGLDDSFETDEEGLEAFVRQVEEFPPLVDLSMIEIVRERGKYYFSVEQMNRLNDAFEDTTAL